MAVGYCHCNHSRHRAGIGALFGKISWQMALMITVGIAFVFGAATIVTGVQTVVSTTGGLGTGTAPGGSDQIGQSFNNIINAINSATGRTIATLAVAALGIAAFFGKTDPG